MKVYRFGVYVIFSCFFLLSFLGASYAEARDFCWEVLLVSNSPENSEESSGILKLRVLNIGRGHYLLSGKLTFDGELNIVHGNAEVVGSNVLMTIVFSGKDNEAMWAETCHVILEEPIFKGNGTIECISHDRNYADLSIDQEFDIGTLTSTPCPK
jgi:hypothetical protein